MPEVAWGTTANPQFTTTTTWTAAAVPWTATTTNFVTSDRLAYELDQFASRLYDIISTYTKLNISEEEFMNLIKEKDNANE